MNIIKNFFKGLITKEKIMGTYLKTKDWVLSLTFMKVTALIVVNCFLLTTVYGQAVAGLLENNRATEQFKQVFDDFNLPYSYGKITSANYEASDTVVINIQDLHSHAEVQKNINNIISLFDEKYGVKNIYLEGAYGDVSTKWLTVAKDENIRNSVMNKLLENGRLTGAEYFSASKGKTEIIKGLENKDVYFDNLKRFGTLIDNQETIALHIDSIKDTVKQLQEQYYNRQQKKIEELSAGYVAGTIEANKYFALMKKHAEKLSVDIDSYPNLSMYMTLLEKQKEINYQRTTQELQLFVVKLKENLPYNAYKMLLSETKNFTQMDKLYGYMIKLSRQYNLDLSQNFKELEKFFAYIELSQAINPMELIKEEQNFKDEINDRFSENKAEEEIVFLSNFVRYYQDYLMGKITTDDCNYYKQNIDRFKYVWVKYIDNREVVALEDYEKISDTFYKINFERNHYFMENMKNVLDGQKISKNVEGKNELQKTMNSLQQAKEVYITVTGGFHTQEMSNMLAKAGVTNIVITPNVTGDTKVAEDIYYNLAQEQAKISFQALAPAIDSVLPNINKLEEYFRAVSQMNLPLDVQKQIFAEVVADLNQEAKKQNKAGITGEVLADNQIKINEKVYTYKDGKVVSEMDEGISDKGMQKSIGSIRKAVKVGTFLAATIGLGTIVGIAFASFGVFPIVALTAAFAKLSFDIGHLKTQEKTIEKILKDKAKESDETENDESEVFKRLFSQLTEGTQKALLKALGCTDISEVDSSKVKIDLKTENGELFEVKDSVLQINGNMLNALLEKGNIKNVRMLETFVKHEIAHLNFANPSGVLKFVKEIIHKVPWLEETIVSLGDLRRYITASFTIKAGSLVAGHFSDAVLDIIEQVVRRDIYGARYSKSSDQSKAQLKFAEELASPEGKVAVLGTSGGKTLGAAISILKQILNNQQLGMADNKILFTSKTDELIRETMDMLVLFFSAPEVIKLLPKSMREKAKNGTLIGFVDQSQNTGYFRVVKRDSNGNIVKDENGKVQFENKPTTKQDVYGNAAIICGSFACFGWDIQGNASKTDSSEYLLQKINEEGMLEDVPFDIFIDETQLVRENSNLVTSASESKRAKQLEPVKTEVADFVGEGKEIDSSCIGKDNKLNNTGLAKSKKLYEKIKAKYPNLNIDRQEWTTMINNAVNAYFEQQLGKDYAVIAVDKNNNYLTVEIDGNDIIFKDGEKIVSKIKKSAYKSKVVINDIEYKIQIGVIDGQTNSINPSVKLGNGLQGAVERVAKDILPSDFKFTIETLTSASDTGVTYLQSHAKSVHAFTGSEEAAEDLAEALGLGLYNANAGGTKALLNNMEFVRTREEQMDLAIDRTLAKFYGVFVNEQGMPQQSGLIFVENANAVDRYYARMISQMVQKGYISSKINTNLQRLIDQNNNLVQQLIEAKNNKDKDAIEDLEKQLDKNSKAIIDIILSSNIRDIKGRLVRDLINTAKFQDSEIKAVKDVLEQTPSLAIVTNLGSTGMDIKYKGIKGVFTVDANDQRTKENDYQTAGRGSRSVENPSTSDKICSQEQILDYLDTDKAAEDLAEALGLGLYNANAGGTKALLNNMEFVLKHL